MHPFKLSRSSKREEPWVLLPSGWDQGWTEGGGVRVTAHQTPATQGLSQLKTDRSVMLITWGNFRTLCSVPSSRTPSHPPSQRMNAAFHATLASRGGLVHAGLAGVDFVADPIGHGRHVGHHHVGPAREGEFASLSAIERGREMKSPEESLVGRKIRSGNRVKL